MKFTIPILALLASAAFAAAPLEGVYERVSLANVETGFSPEKGSRKGRLQRITLPSLR